MEQRIYHGNLTPTNIAEALLAYFNRGNLRTQTVGGSDELRLIRHIRTVRPGTPILILTSNARVALHRKARGLGVWDISVKPTPSAELLSLVANILAAVYPERSKCIINRKRDEERLAGRAI